MKQSIHFYTYINNASIFDNYEMFNRISNYGNCILDLRLLESNAHCKLRGVNLFVVNRRYQNEILKSVRFTEYFVYTYI